MYNRCVFSIQTEEDTIYNPKATPLTVDAAREIVADIVAFALQFYEDGSAEPMPVRWIEDAESVRRFVHSTGLRSAVGNALTAGLVQEAYVRTCNGRTFEIYLYNVQPGKAGTLVLADGSAPTGPELHEIIATAYGMPDYETRRECRRMKMTPPTG